MYLDEGVEADPAHPAGVVALVGQLEPADVHRQCVSLVVQAEPPRLGRLSRLHRHHHVLAAFARIPAQVLGVGPGVAVETLEGDVSSLQAVYVEGGSLCRSEVSLLNSFTQAWGPNAAREAF